MSDTTDEDPIENKLLSAYDVGGAKGFKSEFYRKIYAYKFFMIKRAKNETFKPIELLQKTFMIFSCQQFCEYSKY